MKTIPVKVKLYSLWNNLKKKSSAIVVITTVREDWSKRIVKKKKQKNKKQHFGGLNRITHFWGQYNYFPLYVEFQLRKIPDKTDYLLIFILVLS